MGFFSQECHECHHPALCHPATNDTNGWMTQIVVVTPDGDFHSGEYDGYGNVGGAEYAIGESNTVYHRACWEVAGKPMEYRGSSASAADQGWFFDDPTHDMPDPRLKGASP